MKPGVNSFIYCTLCGATIPRNYGDMHKCVDIGFCYVRQLEPAELQMQSAIKHINDTEAFIQANNIQRVSPYTPID